MNHSIAITFVRSFEQYRMIKDKHNTEPYTWGDNCKGWHLLESDTLTVIEECMPAGTSEQLHFHCRAQQLFYILSGSACMLLDGQVIQLQQGQSLPIKPISLHSISNRTDEDLRFLVISQPPSRGDRVDIIEYSDQYKDAIKDLNKEWLEKYFRVEPIDEVLLADPKGEILSKGGFIFYARIADRVVGTASLLKVDQEVFEVGKMAVTESSQGMGIGKMLLQHAIRFAEQRGAKRLILYSNRRLIPALALYKNAGFVEVPMEAGHYERADIKMEKFLSGG